MPLRTRLLPCVILLAVLLTACGKTTPPPVTSPAPPDGIVHPLEKGLTLYALSRAYGVSVETLIAVNGIPDPSSIPAGTPIFIPGATRRLDVSPATGSGEMAWPLRGRVTSGFGTRGKGRHTGIDIDGNTGDRIRAAAAGRVIQSGRDGRYGLRVMLDHGKGLTTLYAHASKLTVKTGDRVEKGDLIARVGRSGNAHGSHLHFEVRRNNKPVNPIPYMS